MRTTTAQFLTVAQYGFLKLLSNLTYADQVYFDISKADLLFINKVIAANFYLEEEISPLMKIRDSYIKNKAL